VDRYLTPLVAQRQPVPAIGVFHPDGLVPSDGKIGTLILHRASLALPLCCRR